MHFTGLMAMPKKYLNDKGDEITHTHHNFQEIVSPSGFKLELREFLHRKLKLDKNYQLYFNPVFKNYSFLAKTVN